MTSCPYCGSEDIYFLLNTFRCKRCKGIWKERGDGTFSPACSCPQPDTPPLVRKRTEPLPARLEKRLEEMLERHGGKFSLSAAGWQAGDISYELFQRYVRQCVKDRTLAEERDRYGRKWYRKP